MSDSLEEKETPQRIWGDLSEEEKDEATKVIVAKWRERGFPYYNLTEQQRQDEWRRVSTYDRSNLIDEDGKIKQTFHGIGLCWSYFPHIFAIKVGRMYTPMELWNSNELFFKAIRRRAMRLKMKVADSPDITAAQLRIALRTFSSSQGVSNFRPTAAAAIYDRYADGTVWDPSCGFGGRMMGAIVSPKVTKYIGTDPGTLTFAGLEKLRDDWGHLTGTEIEIHCQGSETFRPEEGSISFAFTSPPYFCTEEYAYEDTQSFVKFPTKEEWNEGFLRATIANAFYGLRSGGHLALNVANVKPHKTLEVDCVRIAEEEGFELVETLHLALSAIAKGGHKYEPVFVFRKP